MSPTITLLAHEVRVQIRTLRFRVAAGAFLLLGAAAPVLTFLRRGEMSSRIGAATYPAETMVFLPLAVVSLGFLLSLDGLTRERHHGAWPTLSVAPFSNSGWVLRRFLSLWAIVGALGALPLLSGLGLAIAAGGPVDPWAFALPWALRVMPLAALGTAAGLTFGAIGDGAIPGVAFGILVIFAGGAVLRRLGRWGIESGLSDSWLGSPFLGYKAGRVLEAAAGEVPRYWWEKGMPYPASEAATDVASSLGGYLPFLVPCAALALLALAVAPRFLRRSRGDHRPWRVGPGHPLRGFVGLAGRLRDRYAPDPRPAPRDRLVSFALVALGLGLYGLLSLHALAYRTEGRERWRAEREPPAPTSASVVPVSWAVTGSLKGRILDLRVDVAMENRGREPVDRLAFALDPTMEIVSLESPGGVDLERSWDRVVVTPGRPLEPGATLRMRFRLRGEPAMLLFSVSERRSFQRGFGYYARHGGPALGLAASRREPRVSPRWTELRAGDLFPRPRYTPWDLVEPEYSWQDGPFVSEERVDPTVDLTVGLDVPDSDLRLVDSCGGRLEGGRLESACSTAIGAYALVGGHRERLEGTPPFLALPAHVAVVERLRLDLARAGVRLAASWPGAPRPEELTVVEKPFAGSGPFAWQSRLFAMVDQDRREMEVRNRLLILGEESFAAREPLPPDELAAAVLGSWLGRRRSPVPEEAFLQRWLLETLARRRVWPERASSAVLPPSRAGAGLYALHLTDLEYPAPQAERRLEALLAALEGRLGPGVVRAAVESYLDRPGVGRLDDLFEILGRTSGREEWTTRFYRDFFRGRSVPHLALADVVFRRGRDGWTARGRVENEGDGVVTCAVTLTTEIAPATEEVEVPSGGSVSFALSSPYRPQSLFLDPEESCLRYRSLNPRDRVDFEASDA